MADERRAIDAARLTRLLGARHPGVHVCGVDVLDETSGSANRLRLAVRYEEGKDGGLPARMFLKRNLPRFSFPPEMYTTEVRVYRDVLPGSDVEAPAVYAIDTADEGIEFTILMEDLSTRQACRIGFVLDEVSVDDIDSVLATLARLHAHWWGGGPSWARLPTEDAGMRFWREVGPKLTKRHLERSHRAPLVDQTRWPQERMWRAFDELLCRNSNGATTFLHGDVHAGNVYYLDGGPGGLFDWQLSLRGSWALDVGYILTSALGVDDRRAHERDLVAGYLDRLRALGVEAPDAGDAWLRYRQNALYGVLMWLITPDGVHTDAAQAEYVVRCVTAADDLETLDALVAS